MNATVIQALAAIAMTGIVVALFFGIRHYLTTNSERRMRSMLVSVGLDPEIATSGEMQTIVGEVRQRCRACASEHVCEQWLKGEQKGDNDFCPNARVFEVLRKYSRAA